ncbi:MAG: nucleotidyltransferase family protein [Desulfotomaculales bacterium]
MAGYTERDIAELRAFLRANDTARQRELAERKARALAVARHIAEMLRERYGCRVWLFGSLVGDGGFVEHPNVDLALAGLPEDVDFWKLYAEVLRLAEPVSVDLVLLEAVSPEKREHILTRGVELSPEATVLEAR